MRNLLKYGFVGICAMAALAIVPLVAAAAEVDSQAQDRVAIQQLIVKYAHVYDALDVEGYVSVFAEDAEFTFPGNALHGREDIRKFITGAKQRRDSAPKSEPVTKSYHSISNTLIDFDSATTAHQRSYWQVVSVPASGPATISGMGIYEDTLVKQNGQWLIRTRNIIQ